MKNSHYYFNWRFLRQTSVFILLLFFNFLVHGQDSLWVVGNHTIDFDNESGLLLYDPLPAPGAPNYDGSGAEHACNVQYDEEGELLFFIMDGSIFDSDGMLIADNEDVSGCNECLEKGMNEVSIVKRPGKCDEYYIIRSHHHIGWDFSLQMSLLDLNIVYDEDDPQDCPPDEPTLFPWHDPFPPENPFEFLDFLEQDGWLNDCGPSPYSICLPIPGGGDHSGRMDFDIVDDNPGGDKILFAVTTGRLGAFRIAEDGIFLETDFSNPPAFEPNHEGEGSRHITNLEAIKRDGKYLVAFTEAGSGSDHLGETNLYVLEIENDLTIADTSSIHYIDTHYTGEVGIIGDLGFSAEGNYLYFNTDFSPYLSYLNLNSLGSGTYDLNPVPGTGLTDPEKVQLASAQVEANYLKDTSAMFFIDDVGLSILKNGDDPTNSEFIYHSLSINSIEPSDINAFGGEVGFSDPFNPGTLDYYFLNKQNYGNQQAVELENCCEWMLFSKEEVAHGDTIYNSATWEPHDNPYLDTAVQDDTAEVVVFCDDLVFNSGADITIKNMTLVFTPESEMIIEPGANVKIIGTTLTSLCDEMWPGVTVKGDPTISQLPIYGGGQGLLFMNNSIIEHAYTGVTVGQGVSSLEGGGIIRASNSSFLNNQIDVFMYPYSDDGGSTTYNNRSKFRECEFRTDQALNEETIHPYQHIALNGIEGLRIDRCSFLNTTGYDVYAGHERGKGITATGSSFKVSGNTDFYENDENHTTFYRLFSGIMTLYSSAYICENMAFQHNTYGIFNAFTDNPEIYDNVMWVPEYIPADYGINNPIGIQMTNSTGYKVTRNEFLGTDITVAGVGVWIDESGNDNNFLYKNYFSNLREGVFITGDNAEANNGTGLQVMCNHFDLSFSDIYRYANTTWRADQGGGQNDGIEGLIMPAGNRFSYSVPNCPNQTDVWIHQDNVLETDYYHHEDEVTRPNCNNAGLLYPILVANNFFEEADCPTDFMSHDVGDHTGCPTCEVPVDVAVLASGLTEVEDDIVQTEEVYRQTVDQNDTEDIIAALESAYGSESSYLRDLLLQKYPLSKEVLEKAIEKGEHLDDWHLTQVMVANAPLERDIIEFLEDSGLLSEFFLDFIRDAQDGDDNLRQVLEYQLRGLRQERDDLRQTLSRKYLLTFADTTLSLDSAAVIHKDEYEAMWETYPDHLSRLRYFLQEQEYDSATTVADAIEDPTERGYWNSFVNLAQSVNGNWPSADSSQIASMEGEIANTDNPLRLTYLGILQMIHATDQVVEAKFPIPYRNLELDEEGTERNSDKEYISIQPNPMDVEGFVRFPIEAQGIGRLEVRSMEGRLIKTIDLERQNGIVSLYTSDWSPGIYLISLIVKDRVMDTEKFSVAH